MIGLILTLLILGSVRLRQENNPGRGVEQALTLCKSGDRILPGTTGSGHRTGVTLTVGCPCGGTPDGLYHTHPGGNTYPSQQDVDEMRRLGLKNLCIQVPETGAMDCWRVDKNHYWRLT